MVTSFRLTEHEERLLKLVSKQTGKNQSEIVRRAIAVYCEQLLNEQGQSAYDRLMQSGFRPLKLGSNDLSSNKEMQRKIIREKLTRGTR